MTRTANARASTPNTTTGFKSGARDRSEVSGMVGAPSVRGFEAFRRFEAFGMDHGAVEFDDDGVDVIDPIVDFHGLLWPQHEGGLRQAVGAYGGRPDDGGAAHLARRVASV